MAVAEKPKMRLKMKVSCQLKDAAEDLVNCVKWNLCFEMLLAKITFNYYYYFYYLTVVS